MPATGSLVAHAAVTRDQLSPVQQWTYDGILYALSSDHAFWIGGAQGCGKTTVLRALHCSLGGALLNAADFLQALRGREPQAMEEAFYEIVLAALLEHDLVFVDELDLLVAAMQAGANPRGELLNAPLVSLTAYVAATGKKLVVAGDLPCDSRARWFGWGIQQYREADYRFLCHAMLGEAAASLDIEKIFRFAPNLSSYQLRNTCLWLARTGRLDTEQFIDYLKTHHVTSNVDIEEVQPVELSDLKGLDDLIESLETHIILPLENDALSAEFGLRPKRGVLLAGPPGTGKTTIGKALAHRLKSKFFLIDGTVISGSHNFYQKVEQIFQAARQNADCILFIDDSDVIFEEGKDTGFYRYLLTKLDGLESKSDSRLCVMLTAMNTATLPPALIRSGRVELWLETRLPDVAARKAILEQHMDTAKARLGAVDVDRVAVETDGLTGADLKRVVGDGMLQAARDRATGRPLREPTGYFIEAVASLKCHRERYLADREHITT